MGPDREETRVKLGVHIGQQNLPMEDLRATWRRADEAGVDWISVWDHFYEAPPAGGTVDHFEAIATLGALCAETSNAQIGCLVFYVGYRNPGVIAKAATTLDHISGGRFNLGLGAGWHEPEASAFGYEFPSAGRRLDMLEEAVALIRSLLTTDRTTHDGTWFRTDEASCLPRPVQQRLPIWIGGVGEKRTLPMAARLADGWNAAYVSPEELRRLNGLIDQHCETHGRDPGSLERVVNLVFGMTTTAKQAAAEQDRIRAQWGAGAERVTQGGLYGGPDEAVARIEQYRAAGATGVNVALRAPWDPLALDAYYGLVIPAVRSAVGEAR